MAEHHRNLTVEDVRIDGTAGRILGLGLFGAPAAPSTVTGVILRNISCKHPLRWWPTGSTAAAGDNFVIADSPSSIRDVLFETIVIGGQRVVRHSDWGLNISGHVTNVVYGSIFRVTNSL